MAESDRSLYTAASTWYVAHPGAQTTSTPTVNTMLLWPWELPAPLEIDIIRIDVAAAAGAGGVLKGGFYGVTSGGLPDLSKLLCSFGSVSTTSAGVAAFPTLSPTVRLPRGRVYLAYVAQVAAGSMRVVNGWRPLYPMPSSQSPPSTSGLDCVCYTKTGVSGDLPTSGTVTSMASNTPLRTYFHTV